MLKRLRLKFVLVNMTIVTVMLFIIFGVVLQTTRQNLEEESIRMMQIVANDPGRPGRPSEIPEEIRLPFFTLDIGNNGVVSASGGGYYDLSDQAFLDQLAGTVSSTDAPIGVISEYNLRYLRTQTLWGERLIFADISSEQNTVETLVRNSLLIGAASFFAFLLISIFLARWAVSPVEKAWKQQQQFVADASHELKTPLTVITTNAELLQNPDCSQEKRLQFSGSILTMARQMRTLTESLLNLARVDNGTVKTAFARIDFAQVVSNAILPFEPIFFEKGLSLTTQFEDSIPMTGSERHLRQVVEILLDNTQKYCAEQGTVSISLKTRGRVCLLSVQTPGEELTQEDLKNIFKRFYRVDKARTHDGSYGLGLAIAESIVTEHRGKIWAESANGLNTFFVQLPVL